MSEAFDLFFKEYAAMDAEEGERNGLSSTIPSTVRCSELNTLVHDMQGWAGSDDERIAFTYPLIQELQPLQLECIKGFLSEAAAFVKEVYEREFRRRVLSAR